MTDQSVLSEDQLLQKIRIAELERDALFEIAEGFAKLSVIQGFIGRTGYDLSSGFYADQAKNRVEQLKLLNKIKQERGL